jgi:acetyl-CoA acetyltransferase
MPEAVIVEAVRTPIGRHGGILKEVRPDDLAAESHGAQAESGNLQPRPSHLSVFHSMTSSLVRR